MLLLLTTFGPTQPVDHRRRRRICSLGRYRLRAFSSYLPLPLVGSNLRFRTSLPASSCSSSFCVSQGQGRCFWCKM